MNEAKTSLVRSLLSHKKYRQYNVDIAKRLGGIEYAILLNDLLDQFEHLEENRLLVSHVKYGDGLMYYTMQQAFDRCAISRTSFESAIKLFITLGFIKDVVKFGNLLKRYFRIDINAIYEWLISNNNYECRNLQARMQKPASEDVEISKLTIPNNDSYTIPNNRSPNSPLSEAPIPEPAKSSSLEKEKIGFFDPIKYKLRNGERLKEVTAKSFRKKMQDASYATRIIANVAWYEKQMDEGIKPKKSHEAYLQWAINKNMAAKEDCAWRNTIYAKIMKEEHKLNGLEILKTVVHLDKKDGSRPESVSLNLSEDTFAKIIENFIENSRNS